MFLVNDLKYLYVELIIAGMLKNKVAIAVSKVLGIEVDRLNYRTVAIAYHVFMSDLKAAESVAIRYIEESDTDGLSENCAEGYIIGILKSYLFTAKEHVLKSYVEAGTSVINISAEGHTRKYCLITEAYVKAK